jgi:hypothetical protein
LNEDCWLGINGVSPQSGGQNYITQYKKAVDLITSSNIAVLADLHWTAAGSTLAKGQQPLPDADHAVKFWSQVAAEFADNPLVAYELFNEPFPGKASAQPGDWECWRNASCAGALDVPFKVAGMAQLVAAVRGMGATNVILIGGMAWSNDLSRWLEYSPYELDPLHNTAAVWHAYDFNGCHDEACWERTITPVANKVPVVVTECGFDVSWAKGLWSWIEKQNGTISYLAWVWNVWGNNQALITNYDGTPSSSWGAAFKAQIANAPPVPTAKPVCADGGASPPCNTCAACCHSYIPAGASCSKCAAEQCKAPVASSHGSLQLYST